MESGTRSISKDDTSRLTRVFSAADRPNSNIVSSGVFNLEPFSDGGVASLQPIRINTLQANGFCPGVWKYVGNKPEICDFT